MTERRLVGELVILVIKAKLLERQMRLNWVHEAFTRVLALVVVVLAVGQSSISPGDRGDQSFALCKCHGVVIRAVG